MRSRCFHRSGQARTAFTHHVQRVEVQSTYITAAVHGDWQLLYRQGRLLASVYVGHELHGTLCQSGPAPVPAGNRTPV